MVAEEDMAVHPEVEEEAMVAHPAAVVVEEEAMVAHPAAVVVAEEDTAVHPAAAVEEDTAELEQAKVDLLHPAEEEERRH